MKGVCVRLALLALYAVNIAQHSYFNLAGHDSGKDILDHVVSVIRRRSEENAGFIKPCWTF